MNLDMNPERKYLSNNPSDGFVLVYPLVPPEDRRHLVWHVLRHEARKVTVACKWDNAKNYWILIKNEEGQGPKPIPHSPMLLARQGWTYMMPR